LKKQRCLTFCGSCKAIKS